MVKNIRQGDKNQTRSGGLIHAVGKARRENDQTRCDRDKGIQNHNAHRFAQQRMLFADIAAEDGHRTDA